MPFARIRSALGSALLLMIGCTGELILSNEGGSPGIRVIDGNGQTGQAGEILSDPVIVKVTDGSGQPVSDATVEFALVSAGQGGEISPTSTTTNELGQAQAHLLLGDKIGLQTGEAHLVIDGSSASTATFSALASPGDPENRPPDADFNWHCEDLTCQFTDASSDPDGDVTGWSWQFGDDAKSADAEPIHTYQEPGSYTITLQVTDNAGATDQTATEIEVTLPRHRKHHHSDAKD